MKKVFLGTIGVLGLSTAIIIGSSFTKASADGNATIEMFNELKTQVETLETKLEEANNEIATLKTANEKLITIEEATNQNKDKIATINNSIKTVETNLGNVTARTSKIEEREKVFYRGAIVSEKSVVNIANYIFRNMMD
jgi:predicted  nucleic acid-binding Zn-ribbon protein